MKYHGSVIPYDWDLSFDKFEGLLAVVAFWENHLPSQEQINLNSKY